MVRPRSLLFHACSDLLAVQVIHARSGGAYEIMGLMQGKVVGRTFCVMDSFALPVQGTETRVNAAQEAEGYMISHMEGSKTVRVWEHWRLPGSLCG